MTAKTFLWGMRLVAALASVSVVLLVLYTSPYQNQNPDNTNPINIALLQTAIFFALGGIFSLFFFWLRRRASGNEILGAHLGVSFRQGLLLSLCIVLLLTLQSFRVLTWWDGLLAAGAVLMVELYFLAR
jgi:hypothetical protein